MFVLRRCDWLTLPLGRVDTDASVRSCICVPITKTTMDSSSCAPAKPMVVAKNVVSTMPRPVWIREPGVFGAPVAGESEDPGTTGCSCWAVAIDANVESRLRARRKPTSSTRERLIRCFVKIRSRD